MRATVLAITMCLSAVATGTAQGNTGDRASPQMAMVVESNGGLAAARRVRALLSKQANLEVRPLKNFVDRGAEPDVVVTISIASKKDINVLYWDRTGVADVLNAPVPQARATTSVVAASLAVALLRRNLPALKQAMRTPASRYHRHRVRGRHALSTLSPDQLRGLFASIGFVAHRTEGLTEADF